MCKYQYKREEMFFKLPNGRTCSMSILLGNQEILTSLQLLIHSFVVGVYKMGVY